MAKKTVHVTQYELAVLDVLWQRGSATVREITEAIYQESKPTSYATVQKLLERLENKGCVRRDRSSFAHVFRPKIERTRLIGQGLEDLAEKLCGGSLTPLLVHLVQTTSLSPHDRAMLLKLIDDAT
jgi:BlaI family transcriptional regulator, penicillinase repressor